MLHGRWVRPGQGPWLTEGFAKPLSVDESSIAHLQERQGRPPGRLRRRRRPGRVRGRPGRGAAEGQVGRVADPAGPRATCGRASARRTRPGRCRPGSRRNVGNFDTAFKARGEDGLGDVQGTRTTATRRSAPPARSPTTRRSAGRTRTRSRCSRTRRTSRPRSTGLQETLGLQDREPGPRHLLRGLELVRQRLPLPRHRGVRGADVEAGRRSGPAPADAVGRAGLEQVRPGDHARHARRRRREGQHRRVRGRRVRAGRRRRQRRPRSCSATSPAPRRRGHERREPGPDVQGRPNALGIRATA